MRMNLLAICGLKNTGKTTLIERLLPALLREHLRVAVIKHDGHRYQADVPGTDSHRFLNAGAAAVAVYDEEKYTITRKGMAQKAEILGAFSDTDLILVEGWKQAACAKLEIVRGAVSGKAVSNPENRLALISDCIMAADVPVFHPDDVEKIAAFILEAYRAGRLLADLDAVR